MYSSGKFLWKSKSTKFLNLMLTGISVMFVLKKNNNNGKYFKIFISSYLQKTIQKNANKKKMDAAQLYQRALEAQHEVARSGSLTARLVPHTSRLMWLPCPLLVSRQRHLFLKCGRRQRSVGSGTRLRVSGMMLMRPCLIQMMSLICQMYSSVSFVFLTYIVFNSLNILWSLMFTIFL